MSIIEPDFEDLDRRRQQPRGRRTSDDHKKITLERVVLVVAAAFSVGNFFFSGGTRYGDVVRMGEDIRAVQASKVDKEVYAADQRRLAEAMDRVAKAVERLEERQPGRR